MHSAWDHDCNLNDRFGKPSCMTEFEREIREDERERAVQRVYRACGHTKYEGCRPCIHDEIIAALRALGGSDD